MENGIQLKEEEYTTVSSFVGMIPDGYPGSLWDVHYLKDEEKWAVQKPARGDHIRVMRLGGLYAHHGIYISDEEVIHFSGTDDDSVLDWSKCAVIKTSLAEFLDGGTVEVKIYTDEELQDLYSPDQIVSWARACIDDKGYNLFFNNCEHFANYCTLGRFRSNQVERIASGRMPNGEENDMGILGGIWGGIKGFFSSSGSGSSSRSTYNYEPDKVEITRIENETKLCLADKEQERIKLMKDAQLDILQFQKESQLELERARSQGYAFQAQIIVTLQEKMNRIAQARLEIIEKCSLPIIRDMDKMYEELGRQINADRDAYNTNRLPEMLALLQQYEEGSPVYRLYEKQIEKDMELQAHHVEQQLTNLAERQQKTLDSFLDSRKHVLESSDTMTAGMLEQMKNEALKLSTAGNMKDGVLPTLPGAEKPMLPEGGMQKKIERKKQE